MKSIRYSKEIRKEIISRVAGFEKESIAEVSKNNKIGKVTIYN